MKNNVPDNWYESFFTGINCEMWERAIPEEWTAKEVSFLIDVLEIGKGSDVLDIPLAACLKPGARFIINSGMIAESIIPKIPLEKTYVLGDLTMQINNEYVVSDSYMISHLMYTKNGHSEQHSFKHYVYTIGELKRLLGSYGLKTIALYNGVEKGTYKFGDQQLFLVAEKFVS
ncbi:MAG TPA: hypothetical protein VII44_06745 [Puia sp.]